MAGQVYFETSWSILSTIGVFLTFAGISVILITRACLLNFIPIIVSSAGAVANGICYYAFYMNHPRDQQIAASVFADLFWLIQEAGISFYSYQILSHILSGRTRTLFLLVFWFLIITIVGLRFSITVCRAVQVSRDDLSQQETVSLLHVGYFVSIALVETWSSVFLIKQLTIAYHRSPSSSASTHGMFRYLLRSAELRLASLCFIGISRAVTYSSQSTAQSATGVAGQVDRFVYTFECLFPVIILLDILGSKRYRPHNTGFNPDQIRRERPASPRGTQSPSPSTRKGEIHWGDDHVERRVEDSRHTTSI